MDIEASLERLQKLREWQIEQHEKLLKQQQMQIEVLSHEHEDRISKALSLTICDLNDINENTENVHAMHEIEINTEPLFDKASVFQSSMNNSDNVFDMMDEEVLTDANALYETYKDKEIKDSNHISATADANRNSVKRYNSGILSQEKELSNDLLIEGIKPLSLDNVVSNRCISIDDIPLPSPKKDFQTLLEEKLKKESEAMSNERIDVKTKSKKPFLKKGEGLSRFKITKNSKQPTTMRKHSTSLSSKQCVDKSDKSRKSTIHKDVASKSSNNFVISEKRQLNLKTVPLPRNKIFNKSEHITPNKETAYNAASNRSKYLQEMNMSDSDSKTERELEEVRIFELLEEKAENSSFCSTSSTVLAFLQQSTPFKIKKRLNCAGSEGGVVASTKQQNDERTDDTIERESQRSADKQVANLKPRIQHQFEHFDIHKRSHISTATIDSYSDTVTVNDMQEEIQKHSTIANQVSQNNKVHIDYLKNRDVAIIATLSDSDEEGDISEENNVARNSETDANHRVRFSEYNEYRTIDLSDTADKSPLREHLEQQDWNDHSIDSSELSDVGEENLPLNDEKQMSSLKNMSNEKLILSRRSFLQENINIPEEENALNCENESPGEDIYDDNECTIMEETRTSDEEGEQSVLSSLSSSSSLTDTHRDLNAHKRKEYILRSEPEKITVEKIAKIRSNSKEIDLYHQPEDRTNRNNGFESELLKSRLLELQKEIDIFRKESAALLLQRRNLQEDQMILHKEYAEKERNFEENRRRVENRLEEEKKKLSRERIAMENRIRDAQEKAKQNKMERHKAQTLQEQLEKLRDELNIKESRWHAAESRYKSELRVLRVEISKLKEEIATLENIKRTNIRNIRKSTNGQMITKAINQINKRVKVPSKELPAKITQVLSDTSSDASVHDDNDEDKDRSKSMESIVKTINVNDDFEQIEDISVNNNKVESKAGIDLQPKCNKTFANGNIAKKKQYLYENLLKEATSDFLEDQNPIHIKQNMNESTDTQLRNAKNDGTSGKTNDKSHNKSHHKSTNEDLECTTACAMSNADISFYRSREVNQNSSDKDDMRMQNRMLLPEKSLSSTLCPSSLCHRASGTNTKDIGKQIQYSDGHAEYWYLNGNVKKVFPDRGITKMIYYNGDVRETDKDGKVKYFYATTRTWHTTTPDGLEILEFPDGQVEKRASDGTVEISFPDGAIRIVQADGTEKWSLPDGTVAQTFINGDKILTLPNGQREIHTKEHKRREYPDGTVKLVYADGTQETRYSSGRKRLKDKDACRHTVIWSEER
ncbi:centromere protein J isoform X1 [Cataglyphis hispanica]|uniref:centromere protein J isoform X1 n=1 Tax=Cataglyphis hispanica TaxID=1086592 RepID=UPI00218042FE|nr:centromere protein J isoform X1 [Cataglyphis hispanica]